MSATPAATTTTGSTTGLGRDTIDVEELKKWIWMPHETEVFIPVKPQAYYGETIEVKDQKGKTYTLPANHGFHSVQPSSMEGLDDMINLHELFEGAILHTMRERYALQKIYTFISDIIIAVNPYKDLPLYTKDLMLAYQAETETKPHPYQLANESFLGMSRDGINQAIVISGESGSGKTETTKIVIRYLTFLSGQGNNVEQGLLDANPLIEAFGNAQTTRNHNSSRFGKWIEIQFDNNYRIMGAQIQSFLLEQSRVVSQAKGERNYHIFYQLCAGNTDASLKLGPASSYHLLTCGDTIKLSTGISDADMWKVTQDAMKVLGFTDEMKNDVFAILAAILHLGNVSFEDISDSKNETKSKVSDSSQAELAVAAQLLQVDVNQLGTTLVEKNQTYRAGDTVKIFFNPKQARAARRALTKFLYANVFDFIVSHTNAALRNNKDKVGGVIGVLDIFGFECFDINRFEQLCINYANEKLQQHFNHHVFTLEQKSYVAEDVVVEAVNFNDNQGCIDLIEKTPSGIFPLLDEELVLPKASDIHFADKLKEAQASNPNFKFRKIKTADEFIVKHYPGFVTYEVHGFLKKNKNEIPKELNAIVVVSPVCTRHISPVQEAKKQYTGKAEKGKTSIVTIFRKNLKGLMDTLNASAPHFIRCIKPNAKQVPDDFDAKLCSDQLRYSGVAHVVEVRQQGFPVRLAHKLFFDRYKLIIERTPEEEDTMAGMNGILHRAVVKTFTIRLGLGDKCRVGRTKILLRASGADELDKKKEGYISGLLAKGQAMWRGYSTRKKIKPTMEVHKEMLLAIKRRDIDELEASLKAAQKHLIKNGTVKEATKLLERLKVEKKCMDMLQEAMDTGSSEKMEAAVKYCNKLNFHPEELLKKIREQIVIEKAKTALREAIASQNHDKLVAALAEAKEVGLDYLDKENRYPLATQAYRLRLRLETQASVEADLVRATEANDEKALALAIERAKQIDLPLTVPNLAKALLVQKELSGLTALLENAMEQRSLEDLQAAVEHATKLGQQNRESVAAAKALLERINALDLDIQAAMAKGDIAEITKAITAANQAEMHSSSLAKATLLAREEVVAGLKSAIASRNATKLNAALAKAQLSEAADEKLAAEAAKLLKEVETLDALIVGLARHDEHMVDEAIDRAEQLGLRANTAELQSALKWKSQLQQIRSDLIEAVRERNLEELDDVSNRAAALGVDKTDLLFTQATLLATQLKQVEESLYSVLNSEVADPNILDVIDSALARASDVALSQRSNALTQLKSHKANALDVLAQLTKDTETRNYDKLAMHIAQAKALRLDAHATVTVASALANSFAPFQAKLLDLLKVGSDTDLLALSAVYKDAKSTNINSSSLIEAKSRLEVDSNTLLQRAIDSGDNKKLEEALERVRALGLSDLPLASEAAKRLSKGKDETNVLDELRSAVEQRNEGGLDRALARAKELHLAAFSPDLVVALKYKQDLEDVRASLAKAVESRDLDVLEPSIARADTLGLDKTLESWKAAQVLAPRLRKVATDLKLAMETGDIDSLNTALSAAAEAKMAEHCAVLSEAHLYREEVVKNIAALAEAVDRRNVEGLAAALDAAHKLRLDQKPDVIHAISLHAQLKKIDDDLRSAIASGQVDRLDSAIKAARQAKCSSKALNQAIYRVQEEVKLELALCVEPPPTLRRLQSNKDGNMVNASTPEARTQARTDESRERLEKALARLTALEVSLKDGVFDRAKALYSDLAEKYQAQKAVAAAIDSKDKKKLKEAIAAAEKIGLDEELKAARDYLRRLAASKDLTEEVDERSQPLESVPFMTGTLLKKGVGFPYKWKPRYITLDETNLTYYEDEQKKEHGAKGLINCEWVEARHGKGKYRFFIGSELKNIKFDADSAETRDRWMKAICTNIRVKKRLLRLKHYWELVSGLMPDARPSTSAANSPSNTAMSGARKRSLFDKFVGKGKRFQPTSRLDGPPTLLSKDGFETMIKLVYTPPDAETNQPTKNLFQKFKAGTLRFEDLIECNEGDELKSAQEPIFQKVVSLDFDAFGEDTKNLLKKKVDRKASDFKSLVVTAICPSTKDLTTVLGFFTPMIKTNHGVISWPEFIGGLRASENKGVCARLGFGVHDMHDPEHSG